MTQRKETEMPPQSGTDKLIQQMAAQINDRFEQMHGDIKLLFQKNEDHGKALSKIEAIVEFQVRGEQAVAQLQDRVRVVEEKCTANATQMLIVDRLQVLVTAAEVRLKALEDKGNVEHGQGLIRGKIVLWFGGILAAILGTGGLMFIAWMIQTLVRAATK